jgi:hypothetical protein
VAVGGGVSESLRSSDLNGRTISARGASRRGGKRAMQEALEIETRRSDKRPTVLFLKPWGSILRRYRPGQGNHCLTLCDIAAGQVSRAEASRDESNKNLTSVKNGGEGESEGAFRLKPFRVCFALRSITAQNHSTAGHSVETLEKEIPAVSPSDREWHDIAEQASKELDGKKLAVLIEKLCAALDSRAPRPEDSRRRAGNC